MILNMTTLNDALLKETLGIYQTVITDLIVSRLYRHDFPRSVMPISMIHFDSTLGCTCLTLNEEDFDSSTLAKTQTDHLHS
mmetsp:Transcript_16119/g.38681  ORF Transcript_16119/g.38681 Transcript_16119/m.38681 type:complete len:81 (+) Transcript_16119:71-313(+)